MRGVRPKWDDEAIHMLLQELELFEGLRLLRPSAEGLAMTMYKKITHLMNLCDTRLVLGSLIKKMNIAF